MADPPGRLNRRRNYMLLYTASNDDLYDIYRHGCAHGASQEPVTEATDLDARVKAFMEAFEAAIADVVGNPPRPEVRTSWGSASVGYVQGWSSRLRNRSQAGESVEYYRASWRHLHDLFTDGVLDGSLRPSARKRRGNSSPHRDKKRQMA